MISKLLIFIMLILLGCGGNGDGNDNSVSSSNSSNSNNSSGSDDDDTEVEENSNTEETLDSNSILANLVGLEYDIDVKCNSDNLDCNDIQLTTHEVVVYIMDQDCDTINANMADDLLEGGGPPEYILASSGTEYTSTGNAYKQEGSQMNCNDAGSGGFSCSLTIEEFVSPLDNDNLVELIDVQDDVLSLVVASWIRQTDSSLTNMIGKIDCSETSLQEGASYDTDNFTEIFSMDI